MFNLLYRTVLPFCRNIGDSCLHRSSLSISLRNLSAVSVIKRDRFKLFQTFFENYGFSDKQISKLAKRAHFLNYSLQNNFLPKIKFLLSIGVSSSDLPKVIMGNPALLAASVDRKLIHCYNFLKSLLVSDENVVRILKRSPRILSCNLKVMVLNLELLRKSGMPESFITFLLTQYPLSVQLNSDKFKRSVDRVIEMGCDPSRLTFLRALHVLCETSDRAWENRMKIYGSFGLSNTEILSAFKCQPQCMRLSEEKITKGMQFYVNEGSMSPAEVARCPSILLYSMERRIIPRYRVAKMLMEKGFVKKYSIINLTSMTEERFQKRFLHNYEKDLPEIMDIYRAQQVLWNQ